MSVLYKILTTDDLIALTIEQKMDFISEIIMTGSFEYFEKFIGVLDDNIYEYISSAEVLELLPMKIDPQLLSFIIDNYEFEQGQHFFYNYAYHNDNLEIKRIVYDYFVENYSHIMLDNMGKYESLLEN